MTGSKAAHKGPGSHCLMGGGRAQTPQDKRSIGRGRMAPGHSPLPQSQSQVTTWGDTSFWTSVSFLGKVGQGQKQRDKMRTRKSGAMDAGGK